MNYKRTSLLAGVAVLALFGGGGLASAQDSSKSESGKGATPHAAQQMNQGGISGQQNRGAQSQERGPVSQQRQHAEKNGRATGQKGTSEENRSQKEEQDRSAQSDEKKNTTAGSSESQTGEATQEHNKKATESDRPNRSNTAQERERSGGNRTGDRTNMNAQRGRTGTKGLQGNAFAMNVQLNEQQRNEIRTTVINARGAPRVSNVDFDVTVGTAIPRGKIHVISVPEALVRIEPEWRGFLYFVYEDEVVIVNPNDMKIVAVVPA